ncbi:hypothetical protein ACLB2K_002028 [Fragaria x ananassa]
MDNKKELITCYFSDSVSERRASELQEAWPELLAALEKCGITSLKLNLTESDLTASITRTHCQDYRAHRLLELLATTNVPPSLAIELALNDKVTYDLIKIGQQEGGFAWKYGINQKQFAERREWLEKHYLEALEFATDCHLYLGAQTLTAVATKSGWPVSLGLKTIRTLVEQRIRYGPD